MTDVSNLGKWDRWYAHVGDEPQVYGDTPSYQMAADHVAQCAMVEDWGCGKGWMRRFIPEDRYVGIDGSHSPFADKIVDLVDYRSEVPGIVMRHVLEHEYRWHLVLENALASAQERIAVVNYAPPQRYTRQIDFEDDPGVPVIGFRIEDITDRFKDAGFGVTVEELPGGANYGCETLIFGVR